MFVATDCSLLEINPLVVTGAGELLALDAKMTLRRQRPVPPSRDLAELRDLAEEEPAEVRAGQGGPELRQAATATSAAWSTAPGWP